MKLSKIKIGSDFVPPEPISGYMNMGIFLEDRNWEKIGEYIDSKYWVDAKTRLLGQKLSTKEDEVFRVGDKVAGDLLEVWGFGETIYRNKTTKEEIRSPLIKGEK